ncbi:fimbria/pilus chaperone family protein [Cedecea neteri]|uniref:fimbria/pilus chaperone family protein n=1 Tax=Cedecea neteri TaxID=158822 RepID=UPI002892B2C7|nr:fimbria/pilus chaperone family protein [Cedecea neteri]WNJ78478.1 fimbria/pilus chaperone family protein [Cedecea neteri]
MILIRGIMKVTSLFVSMSSALLFCTTGVQAAGMIPETSIVIIEQADGEGAINVKNSDGSPALLITTLQNIADDKITNLLSVTPPAARVEPGKSQRVRFILIDKTPLKTERLGRVIFEGVPPQKKDENVVRLNIRQNLPLLIRPAGLAKDEAPWKRLTWKQAGNQLTVSNDSPYVVRLGQGVQTLPDNVSWALPQSYVLPGQKITISPDKDKQPGVASSVRISPATTWGYSAGTFDAPVSR